MTGFEFITENKVRLTESDIIINEGDIVHDIGYNSDFLLKNFYKKDGTVFYINQSSNETHAARLDEFDRKFNRDLFELK